METRVNVMTTDARTRCVGEFASSAVSRVRVFLNEIVFFARHRAGVSASCTQLRRSRQHDHQLDEKKASSMLGNVFFLNNLNEREKNFERASIGLDASLCASCCVFFLAQRGDPKLGRHFH